MQNRAMRLEKIVLDELEIRLFERAAKISGRTLDEEICVQIGRTIQRLQHLEKLERERHAQIKVIRIGVSSAY